MGLEGGMIAKREVIISIRAQMDDVRGKFAQDINNLEKKIIEAKRKLDNRMATIASRKPAERLSDPMRIKYTKELNNAKAALSQAYRDQKDEMVPLQEKMVAEKRALEKLGIAYDKVHGKFQGWALSVMFAGMQMLAVVRQVWMNSTKSFQDIMHSVEGTTTGFDNLNGAMKYLGFVVGQALEPLAELLTPIIIKFAEWVQDNEELVQKIVKWTAIIGAGLMLVGQLRLAFQGIKTMVNLAALAAQSMSFALLRALPFLTTPAGIGLLTLLALGAVTWKALKETPAAMEAIKESLKGIDLTPLEDSLKNVWGSVVGLPLTWEDIAWTIAWAVDKSKYQLDRLVNAFAAVGNVLATLFNMAKAVWSALSGDESAFLENVKDMNNSLQGLKDNFKNIWDATVDEINAPTETPAQYKARLLAEAAARNSGYMSTEVMSRAPYEGYGMMSSEQGTIVVQNLTVQADNPMSMERELMSRYRG